MADDPEMENLPLPDVETYFDQPELSDVTLRFGGVEMRAHRYVLCRNSKYFRGLFTGKFAESEKKSIDLVDDDGDAIRAMLRHIYGLPYLPEDEDDRLLLPHARVYIVAEKYGLLDLKGAIFKRLFTGRSLWKIDWSNLTSDIHESLSTIIPHTPESDAMLRPAIIMLCTQNLHEWGTAANEIRLKHLLGEVPGLGNAITFSMSQSLGNLVSIFTCPICFNTRMQGASVDGSGMEVKTCPMCEHFVGSALDDDTNWLLFQGRLDMDYPLRRRFNSADELAE